MAWRKAAKLIWDAFAHQSPRIPALNKWNNLFHPLAWWSFASGFHCAILRLFCLFSKPPTQPDEGAGHFNDDDIFGIGADDTCHKAQAARFKTFIWSNTLPELTSSLQIRSLSSLAEFMFRSFDFNSWACKGS